jgi:signal transduction histidine kinase/ActR/RegA family two-component response regulator
LEREVVVFIGIALVLMAASGAQASFRSLAWAFTLVLTVVFVSGLLRFHDTLHVLMAIGFCQVSITTLMSARDQERSVKEQIALQFEKEELLRAAENARVTAENANRAKTSFLAAASHDLRQPMHALTQYVAHLRSRNQDPKLADTIVRIDKSLDSMQGLLDSLLEMSKVLMGAIEPVMGSANLSTVLDRIDTQMRPLATDKGLQFSILESQGDVYVQTDDILLERVLRNVTLNAIRYTTTGGILIRCKPRSGGVRCQVWDTGIGIPRAERNRIFEAFYQVDNASRDRRKGLGLGLAIVRHLCDLLGIPIRMHSKVSKGTVFSLDLPVAQRDDTTNLHSANQPVMAQQRDYARGASVVLIDDDPDTREATAYTLRSFGCRVISAGSGLEALERLSGQEFAPQIILADYRLEGESGIQAIEMVTQNLQALYGESFQIPALIVSGDTAPDELEKVRNAGYKMLHKPVPVESLYTEINNALERRALAIGF